MSRLPVSERIPALEKLLAEREPSIPRWQAKLLLGKSYVENKDFAKAEAVLDQPDVGQCPLWEFGTRYIIEAREGKDSKYSGIDLWKKLHEAEGEASFRFEAAGKLAGYHFSSGNYEKALPLLESLLASFPDNPSLNYKIARSYFVSSGRAMAMPFAKKLYTEFPVSRETLALFEECPALEPDLSELTNEEIRKRLLRLEEQGGFFRLEKEMPLFERYLEPDQSAFLSASLLVFKNKAPEAVGLFLKTPPSSPLYANALEKCVSNIKNAKGRAPEIEKALILLGAKEKERLLGELFDYYRKASMNGDAARIARQLLAFSDADAAEYLYKGAWKTHLAGDTKRSSTALRELVKLLPDENDYHQAALFSLLEMKALNQKDSEAAKGELLASSRYGYYGYRLRGGMPPQAEAASSSLPPILSPPAKKSRRFKAALLAEAGLGDDAIAELESLIKAGERPELLWELSLVASKAKIYPKSVRAARKLYPDAYSENGDKLPRQAWEMIYPLPYFDSFERTAREKGVPLPTLYSIARQESLFDIAAVSKAGARGMIQLMPSTARMVAKKNEILLESDEMLNDVDVNLDIGSRYFLSIYRQFGSNLPMALAGYNAGPGRPAEWNKRPNNPQKETLFIESIPFRETRSYVKRIMNNIWEYKRLYPELKDKA
ncbi:MAG TPA: lytic transglycosylase domain-containing protein [Acidobacteriota bacterium]|mgnify:CR=1 FL=1|nr:lytic transglycosylase domain-containing protein [Acidobacteriota bacterium]HQO20665.1 lytic transglycosylase domain-containing protein [Acidobacteriota bacterium]HQQ47878.1 lytic transglycosylase domain-containing protein [Acidobacteriota bacterium]